MVTICRTSALLPHAYLQAIWVIWNLLGDTIYHCFLVLHSAIINTAGNASVCIEEWQSHAALLCFFVMQECLIK